VFSHVILVCGSLVYLVLVQLYVFSPVILMNKSCLERMWYGMNFVYVRFQVGAEGGGTEGGLAPPTSC
jgi:hypothetical protein